MSFKGTRVLVADDEVELREAVADVFRMVGCEVLVAENGKAALSLIEEGAVDLIISDVRMPGGDGLELLRNLRSKHSSFPPVILVAGYSDVDEASAIALGAHKMVHKPFLMKRLIDEARQALSVRTG